MVSNFSKKTIDDIEVAGQRVLLRADYNVPMENGVITDDFKIKSSLPTLRKLIDEGARLVICSHLGRPGGRRRNELSLKPVQKRLSELLKMDVDFADDIFAEDLTKRVKSLDEGQVMLLENVRFWPGEEINDDHMTSRLAALSDIFVMDGFGVSHREHASTHGVAQKVEQAVAGYLLKSEHEAIANIAFEPIRPFTAVIGGSKIKDKIKLIESFIETADNIIIGGAMANDFLVAQGHDVEDSKFDPESVDEAKRIIKLVEQQREVRKLVLAIPSDVVVGHSIDKENSPSIVDLSSFHYVDTVFYPQRPPKNTITLQDTEMIGDIGPYSTAYARGIIASSGTVIWNGLLGVVETDPAAGETLGPFEFASYYVAQEIIDQTKAGLKSMVGGGDTAGYVVNKEMAEGFSHVSTGGGASIDLLADQHLPSVDVLDDAPDDGELTDMDYEEFEDTPDDQADQTANSDYSNDEMYDDSSTDL